MWKEKSAGGSSGGRLEEQNVDRDVGREDSALEISRGTGASLRTELEAICVTFWQSGYNMPVTGELEWGQVHKQWIN